MRYLACAWQRRTEIVSCRFPSCSPTSATFESNSQLHVPASGHRSDMGDGIVIYLDLCSRRRDRLNSTCLTCSCI